MMLVARLALADAWHDRRLFACFALTVASVLLPLLLLLGLKTGVVDHLVAGLRADPANRRIEHVGHRGFEAAWFAALAARPEVGFLVPLTRELSLSAYAGRPEDPLRGQAVNLVPSGPGDPELAVAPEGPDTVVVSDRLARQAGFRAGDDLLIWALRNTAAPRRGNARLRIAAIAPPNGSPRLDVYVPPALVADVERFLEGHAVPARGWAGEGANGGAGEGAGDGRREEAARPPVFASFRLYARDIDAVAPLEARLVAEGLNVRSNLSRILWTRAIERNLSVLFAVLTACAGVGVALALSASLWANVERKRRALSLLRLMGLRPRRLAAFPLVQAAAVALAGGGMASAAALAVAAAINAAFGGEYLGDAPLCAIRPSHVLGALGASLAVSLLAGLAAVRPVLRIAPAEGIREV